MGACLKWASEVEDLPDPGILKKTSADEAQTTLDIRKRRWADLVGASGTATDKEKASLQSSAPAWVQKPGNPSSKTPGGVAAQKPAGKVVMPPKAGSGTTGVSGVTGGA